MIKVSNSQLNTYKRCPISWDYNYNVGIKKKGGSVRHFDVGTYMHELLHVMYQLIKEGYTAGSDKLMLAMQHRIEQDLSELNVENIEVMSTVFKMFSRFITTQSPQIDAGIKVIGVEHEFEIPVVTPGGKEVALIGYIDLIYQKAGKVYLRDHKTGGRPHTFSNNNVKFDSQLLFYNLAMLLEGMNVAGVEINYINSYPYKQTPDPSKFFGFYRHEHNPKALDRFKERTLQLIDHMLDSTPWHSYSKDCYGCQYGDLCYLDLRGLPLERTIDTYYEKINRHVSTQDTEGSNADTEDNNLD